jgi:hypothetical protein
VLNFLQKFHHHQNALLANVNLSISRQPMKKAQPVMSQILPLIGDNIDSLELDDDDWLCYIRFLNNVQGSGNNDEFSELMTKMMGIDNNEEFSELMTKMLAQIRILSIRFV